MLRFIKRLFFFGGSLLTIYLGFLRPRLARWNATDEEVQGRHPGDALLPYPLLQTNCSITIRAPASRVWQWIVQIGYGRGGFYSYDWLERAAGLAGLRSATRIDPELQNLAVGDTVAISPVTPMKVAVLEPEKALVLKVLMSPFTAKVLEPGNPPEPWMDWTWAFLITPLDNSSCRLASRVRAVYAPYVQLWPLMALMVEPVSFIMDRKLLLTVKQRAEQSGLQGAE
jgi:hypothetical protein